MLVLIAAVVSIISIEIHKTEELAYPTVYMPGYTLMEQYQRREQDKNL